MLPGLSTMMSLETPQLKSISSITVIAILFSSAQSRMAFPEVNKVLVQMFGEGDLGNLLIA